ncbi:MAG TPA: amidohydrolase family protein [Chloroflexota bacterium]|nr:amidohydrolase family protein [Chloroflexota bacterium]
MVDVQTAKPDRTPPVATSVIDSGVHHTWTNQTELLSYMPRAWRAYLGTTNPVVPDSLYRNPEGDYLAAARPPGDGQPGSDLTALVRDVLTGGVERAILAFDKGSLLPATVNHYLGLQATQAANRWSIERWLSGQDERLYGLILVPNQLPDEAAKEIRRVGQHPRMAGVLMAGNGIGKPFGHPLYDPIYAAAADLDLPVVIQAGGDAVPDTLTDPTPGGLALTFGEFASLVGCSLLTHIVSLVAQGVFEKFPNLKVLMVGGGPAWIPWAFWRADTTWKGLRREIPWVRRPPSEYFREHVRIGTHPLPRSQGAANLTRLLNAVDGIDDLLCFTSSYPHWNTDSVADAASLLPSQWHQKVFHDNAEQFFRWSAPTQKRSRRRSRVGILPGGAFQAAARNGQADSVEYPGWTSNVPVDYD